MIDDSAVLVCSYLKLNYGPKISPFYHSLLRSSFSFDEIVSNKSKKL